jgi:hypothetical protein
VRYKTQIVGYRVKNTAEGHLKIESEWTSEITDYNLSGEVKNAFIQKVKGRTRLFLVDSSNTLTFLNMRDGKKDTDLSISLPPFDSLKS